MNWSKVAFGVAMLLVLMNGMARAKDAVQGAVTSAPGSIQIDENGNPYAAGTYAVGTIRLLYNEEAPAWTAGVFAEFDLRIKIKEGKSGADTQYPVSLQFRQTGSSNLLLSVTNCTDLTDAAWDGSALNLMSESAEARCTVKISIPDVDPALNYDGSLLVGNLQMETPAGAHLDTVTSIQVKIMLVELTSCLRLFNVISDFGLGTEVNDLGINAFPLDHKNKPGEIKGTSPSNLADVAYLVNTCGTDLYADLLLTMDPNFGPPPGNGMSVFFFTSVRFDTDTESLTDAWGDGDFDDLGSPEQGSQNKCLVNQLVPADSTLLIRAKMRLATDNASDLPSGGEFSGFSTEVYEADTNCSGSLNSYATPNPAAVTVPFTISYGN